MCFDSLAEQIDETAADIKPFSHDSAFTLRVLWLRKSVSTSKMESLPGVKMKA